MEKNVPHPTRRVVLTVRQLHRLGFGRVRLVPGTLGRGDDHDYVTWYADMVQATEPAGLIYAYSDWGDAEPGLLNVAGRSRVATVPFPPPGEVEASQA